MSLQMENEICRHFWPSCTTRLLFDFFITSADLTGVYAKTRNFSPRKRFSKHFIKGCSICRNLLLKKHIFLFLVIAFQPKKTINMILYWSAVIENTWSATFSKLRTNNAALKSDSHIVNIQHPLQAKFSY